MNIENLKVIDLKLRSDDRGDLFEAIHNYDIDKFGQVYVVQDRTRNTIRAFHKHHKLIDYFCIIHGSAKFVFEKDGKIDTIQARYTTPTNGVLQVKLSSSWADKNGNHKRKRKKQDFTVLSVYNPEDDRVYFIRASGFNNGRAINLRLVPAANGQKRGVRMAEDYLEL